MSTRQDRRNLLIIGYFGYVENQLDGQTVKTRNIYRLITERLNNYNILIFDTQQIHFGKLSAVELIFKCIKANKIFYIPAQNNLKKFFIPLFLFSRFLNKKLYYFTVGGWLPEFLNRRYLIKKFMSKLNVIFVENKAVRKRLIDQHNFKNVYVLPNFRITNFVPAISNNNYKDHKLRVVFMGRIHRLKGIDIIFKMSKQMQNFFHKYNIEMDFYGPVDLKDEDYFYCNIGKFDFLKYKGVLEPEEIYNTLSKYDVLVLPSRYPGEGFPGSILDAYISGIPVIVSNWKYLSECVDESKSGFLIEEDDYEMLFYHIKWLSLHPDALLEMKQFAREKSKQYHPDVAWDIISRYL